MAFFKHEKLGAVAKYTNERKKYYHKQALAQNKYAPIKSVDLQNFYNLSKLLEDKILIRLLLFEHSTPVTKVAKITISNNSDELHFYSEGHEISIDGQTLDLIKELNKNNPPNKYQVLPYTSTRSIQGHIDELSQLMRLKYKTKFDFYAKYLRKFGQNIDKEDLNKWLSDVAKPAS